MKKLGFIVIAIVSVILACVSMTSQKLDNRKVIQFASWGSQSEVDILKPLLDEFEAENKDIKVDFIHIPQNYFQKIHLLFASNLAPDVLFLNNLYLPLYANAGVLSPINFDDFSAIRQDDFYKKSIKALSFNQNIYAVPRDISNLVVYYNKDIFNKYGIPCPNKYWTFDDFLSLAQKLTKDTNGDGKTDLWGISFDEEPALYYLPYLMSEGGGFLSDDTKKIIIDSNNSQKGLMFYVDLRKKYHVAPTDSESASQTMSQMFLDGHLAMQVSGRWLVPMYKNNAKFRWNVVTFPRGDSGSVVPLDASGWAIAKSSVHKKEAIRLIEFLASKNSIEKFTRSGLIVPARVDVANGSFIKDDDSEVNNEVFLDAIKKSKPTPVSVDYNRVLDQINQKTKYLFE